jgi:hypothetical protein
MLAILDMVNYIFDPDYYKHNSKVSLICPNYHNLHTRMEQHKWNIKWRKYNTNDKKPQTLLTFFHCLDTLVFVYVYVIKQFYIIITALCFVWIVISRTYSVKLSMNPLKQLRILCSPFVTRFTWPLAFDLKPFSLCCNNYIAMVIPDTFMYFSYLAFNIFTTAINGTLHQVKGQHDRLWWQSCGKNYR